MSYPMQCTAHRLSTTILTDWNRTKTDYPEAEELFKSTTRLVQLMKVSRLYYLPLKTKLKCICFTRWNTLLSHLNLSKVLIVDVKIF